MTTQRDRLAAVVHATVCDGMAHTDTIGYGDPNGMDEELADALLARGVRIVDAETLAAALVVAGLPGLPGEAERILAALDARGKE